MGIRCDRIAAGLLPALLCSAAAQAAVYRCEFDGRTVYTDQACTAAAQAAQLPALQAVPAGPAENDLAERYDRGQEAATQARDDADAAWLKRYRAEKLRREAVRRGLVEGRVVEGMTPDEVERVLGEPTRRSGSRDAPRRCTYVNGRSQRVVEFSQGVVVRVRSRRR